MTRRPHYPGDYAHVARCQKCNRDAARIQRMEDAPASTPTHRESQAAYDDWYDSVPAQDSFDPEKIEDPEKKGSSA